MGLQIYEEKFDFLAVELSQIEVESHHLDRISRYMNLSDELSLRQVPQKYLLYYPRIAV